MATIGTYYTYYVYSGSNTPANPDVRFKFVINETVNASSNTSNISITKYANIYSTATFSSSVEAISYVNGTPKTSSANVSGSTSKTVWTLVGTSTYNGIEHNSNGAGSITFNGKGIIGGLYAWVGQKTVSLTTIPRTSTITNNTSSSSTKDFGEAIAFTITPPSGSNFTHTLTYKVGSTTYTIGTGITTSKSYTFPTSLIASFTGTAKPTITVSCASSNGTTSTTTVYLQVPTTYVPTCSLAIEDVLANKPATLSGLWIKNKSLLKGTITAAGTEGSTISSYASSISDFSTVYNTNPYTTQALTIAGSRTVTSTVTDSRGRTATDTEAINVIDYTSPTIVSAKVERCLQDGTISEVGTYSKITCQYKVSPLNNGTTNLNTATLTVGRTGTTDVWSYTITDYEGTVSVVVLGNIDLDASYTYSFALTDIFNIPTNYSYILGVAYMTESKRAGGRGITYGRTATEDGWHNYMDAEFHGDLEIPSTTTMGGSPIIDSGSNTNGSWAKYADGTMECYSNKTYTGVNMTTVYGGVYYSTTSSVWVFPQEFIESPTVTPGYTSGGVGGLVLSGITLTQAGARPFNGKTWSNASFTINWRAIGKWK